MTSPIPPLAIAAVFALALAPAAQAGDAGHPAAAITLTKTIALDSQGRLQASPGQYVEVRAAPDGVYYASGKSESAGTLAGYYQPKLPIAPTKGVVIPPVKAIAYIELLADGVTLCGADQGFGRLACTKTDAVQRQ